MPDDIKIGKQITLEEIKHAWSPAWPFTQDPRIPSWLISEEKSRELLKGFIDSHFHGAPQALWPHSPSIFKTCIEASEAGMKALIFKDHWTMTSDRAYVIQEYLDMRANQEEGFTPAQIYGGVTLNYAIGGLNPEAVKRSLSGDFAKHTKCIWMPSTDSAWQYKWQNKQGGIRIIDKGKLKNEVKEIIEIVAGASHKVAIGTSHLSQEERLVITEACKKAGVDIIITHVTQELTAATMEEAKEFIKMGAWLEIAQTSVMGTPIVGAGWGVNFNFALRLIQEIGPNHIILVTDSGMPGAKPVWAARMLIMVLMAHGISEDAVNMMAKDNPARVFGIN